MRASWPSSRNERQPPYSRVCSEVLDLGLATTRDAPHSGLAQGLLYVPLGAWHGPAFFVCHQKGGRSRSERSRVRLSNERLGRLADGVAAIGARHLGRGPVSVKVRVEGPVVTVEVRGVLSPLEKTLIKCGHSDLVREVREVLVAGLRPCWDELFQQELGVRIRHIDSKTLCEADTRIIEFCVE